MNNKFIKLIKSNWNTVLISIVVLFLIATNYKAGTTLTGWDNLHPEYNLGLNLKRALSTTWQEYQGVGLLGGMGHAADFVRVLFLLPISALLPTSLVRWVSTGFCLMCGAIGMSVFTKRVSKTQANGNALPVIGFVSALIYLLNLGTIENFYVTFEPFAWFYAFLPWLLLSVFNFVIKPTRKNALILFAIHILASPFGYLQTAFLVYFISVTATLFVGVLINNKSNKASLIKNALSVLGLILCANLFWFLPVIYFTLTNSSVTVNATMNQLATPEVSLSNQGMSSVLNIASLQGYWMHLQDMNPDGTFSYLLSPWVTYLVTSNAIFVWYFAFLLSVLGVLYAFISKNKFNISLGIVFLSWLFLLRGESPPFGFLVTFFTNHIPLFSQIFRSPYTKVIVPVSFLYSFFASQGFLLIWNFISRVRKTSFRTIVHAFALIGIIFAVLYASVPAFQGNFFYQKDKNVVPASYENLFAYMKTQPKQTRAAVFPMQSLWGWNFNDWGYRGSGFLWYGIEQPILDRGFDVWSTYNEQFYNLASTALFSQNEKAFSEVLKRFDVTYLIIDSSITTVPSTKESLFISPTIKLITKIGGQKTFEDNSISVYKIPGMAESFVTSPSSYEVHSKDMNTFKGRILTDKNSEAVTVEDNLNTSVEYPWSDVSDIKTKGLAVQSQLLSNPHITISRNVSESSAKRYLKISAFPEGLTLEVPTKAKYENGVITFTFSPIVGIEDGNGKTVGDIQIPQVYVQVLPHLQKIYAKIGNVTFFLNEGSPDTEIGSLTINPSEDLSLSVFSAEDIAAEKTTALSSLDFNSCWTRDNGKPLINISKNKGLTTFKISDAVSCSAYKIGSAKGEGALINISLPFSSIDGARPSFCLVEEGTDTCLHDDIFATTQTSSEFTSLKRSVFVPGGKTYWLVISARPSDEPGRVWSISYRDPTVAIYPLISKFNLKSSAWDFLTKPQEISLNTDVNSLTLNIQTNPTNYSPKLWQRYQAYNCDIFKRGTVNKKIVSDSVIFSANERGSVCDYLQLYGLSGNKDYVLSVNGENILGRGLKLYISNATTSHVDIESSVSQGKTNGMFNEFFGLLGSENYIKQIPYTINSEVRSFGGEEASSSLGTISAYPVPISWITSFSVESKDSQNVKNIMKVNESRKFGTFLYVTNLTFSEEGKGFIKLSQGYDPGWIAISGVSISHHIRIDGWANGWIVSGEKDQTVFLIYLPQILQYVGFLVLIFITVRLIKKKS